MPAKRFVLDASVAVEWFLPSGGPGGRYGTVLHPVSVLLHQRAALRLAQVLAHHLLDQLLEARFRLPMQFLLRPGGIADEGVHFGGPEITRVHGDDFFSGGVERVLIDALAAPLEADV